MRTKLEAIKWALAYLDEVVYFANRRYRIVGVGLTENGWDALCQVKKGWTKLDSDDCILSDLTSEDDNKFSYLSINEFEKKWGRKKV